jgi:hypothetical protein
MSRLLNHHELLIENYMQESFFLPADVLQDAKSLGWMIPDIQIVPTKEFIDSVRELHNISEFKGLKYEPCLEIVAAGERVGVAIRRHEQQQKLFVICKTWYDSKNQNRGNHHGG